MFNLPKERLGVSPEKERSPRFVERFVVIDMDRTLFATDNFGTYVYDVFGLDDDERQAAEQAVLSSKGSGFDTFGYLQQRHPGKLQRFSGEAGELDVGSMADWLVERHGLQQLQDALLLPGARELFRVLDERELPHGVLTTGEDSYQQLKAAVLRRLLDRPGLPVMVVDGANVPDKTAMLVDACWQETSQYFLLPVQLSGELIAARNLVVIDDKDENLASPHASIHAVHIGTHDLFAAAKMIDK